MRLLDRVGPQAAGFFEVKGSSLLGLLPGPPLGEVEECPGGCSRSFGLHVGLVRVRQGQVGHEFSESHSAMLRLRPHIIQGQGTYLHRVHAVMKH